MCSPTLQTPPFKSYAAKNIEKVKKKAQSFTGFDFFYKDIKPMTSNQIESCAEYSILSENVI